MAFTLRIETDNAAFEDAGSGVARILRELADTVDDWGYGTSTVRDINGNTVGTWTLDHQGEEA